MIDLPDVTLICFERRDPRKALALMTTMAQAFNFGDVRWANRHYSYESFCHAEFTLWKDVRTSHLLVTHLDGFVLRPDLWNPDWLKYDYVGAPWPVGHFAQPGWTFQVGNCGFCLRSRALSERMTNLEWKCGAFDQCVSQVWRDRLVGEGYQFPSVEEAAKFSVEHKIPETPAETFGFHGVWPLTTPPPDFYSPGFCAVTDLQQ